MHFVRPARWMRLRAVPGTVLEDPLDGQRRALGAGGQGPVVGRPRPPGPLGAGSVVVGDRVTAEPLVLEVAPSGGIAKGRGVVHSNGGFGPAARAPTVRASGSWILCG